MGVDGQLETGVADVSVVAHRRLQAGVGVTHRSHVGGHLQVHQHVFRFFLVPVEGQIDAVVEETQIQTDIELLLLLPFHIQVRDVLRTVACAQRGVHLLHVHAPHIGVDVGVTGLSPAQAQLSVAQPLDVFHKLLVGEAPGCGKGVESRPAVVGTEVRRTVVTVGISGIVAVVIAVGQAGKEGSHGTAAETASDGGRACSQRGIVYGVRREVVIGYFRIVPLALPALLPQHDIHRMLLGKRVAIGHVVLQLPEGVVVLLDAAFIRLFPVGKVDGVVVDFGFAVTDVVTHFGMPSDVLDGGQLRIDVSRQFLAVQHVVLLHRFGYRVVDAVVLAGKRGVVAVDVVDRRFGQRGQGKAHDTFGTVRQFQVVVGIGKGGAQAQFQPLLQLRIQVGTHGQAVEVGANQRTFLAHVTRRHVVLNLLRTALRRYLVLVLEGCLEDGILPVGTHAQQRDIAIVGVLLHATETRGDEVVIIVAKAAQVEHIQPFGLAAHCHHAVVGEFCLTRLAALGGNQHHTVGALCAVDGSGRSVFQDFHAQDIRRVDGGQGRDGRGRTVIERIAEAERSAAGVSALHNHTVDDIQRLGIGVDGGLSAHADGRCRTRSTGSLHSRHTGGTSLQRLVQVGDDGAFKLVFAHGNRCAGEVALLHRTVAHHDHLVQHLAVFFQRDVQSRLVRHLYLLADIAYKGYHEGSSRFYVQGEVTVDVGNHAVRGALLQYVGTDDRSHRIADGTRNLFCLLHSQGGISR